MASRSGLYSRGHVTAIVSNESNDDMDCILIDLSYEDLDMISLLLLVDCGEQMGVGDNAVYDCGERIIGAVDCSRR